MWDDRTPPSDIDAEAAVLAACMHLPVALGHCIELLQPDDFHHPFHQSLFLACQVLFKRGEPVDLITLKNELPADQFPQLVEAYGHVPIEGHTKKHVQILRDLTTRRRAIASLKDAIEDLQTQPSEGPLSTLMGRMMRLQVRDPAVGVRGLAEVMARERDRIMTLVRKRDAGDHTDHRPATFGLDALDQLVTLTRDSYVLLGARPSAGKTALALQVASHNARLGKRVLFFSLEMDQESLARRFITQQHGIGAHRMLTGYLNTAEVAGVDGAAGLAAKEYPGLLINDKAGLTVAQMQGALMRALHSHGGIDLVVIDHLIKVRSSLRGESSKHAQLSQISNDLRELVRNHRIPLLCLTQLRRPQQGQEEKSPELTDLRESGSLEEDADVIALLHRPDRTEMHSPASLYIGKNRNGPVGRVSLLYQAMYTRFIPAPEEAPSWH